MSWRFQGFWPLQTDDTTGITAHLNRVRPPGGPGCGVVLLVYARA